MIKEFREFILRGNLVDLAVAVVIGAAFTTVINASSRTWSRLSLRRSAESPTSPR